jgi:hypothetical protein
MLIDPYSSGSYLANRLGLATDLETAPLNDATKLALTERLSPSSVSASISLEGKSYLVLRDSLNDWNSAVSLVQVTEADLEEISGFLEQIIQIESALADNSGDPELLEASLDRLFELEQGLSQFLGQRAGKTSDVLITFNALAESQKRYFDTFNLADLNIDGLTGQVAVLEVDVNTYLNSVHQPFSCPVCMAQTGAMGASFGGELMFAEAPATNTTNVTGSTTSTNSGISYIEPLRAGPIWNLSPGETLSYSYYTGSGGVPYSDEYASLAQYNAPLGASAISPANQLLLDQAFAAWDNAANFSFEKVTESGTTVGEIRSAYTTRTYASATSAAYAYYPGDLAINGDIWYIDDQATNDDFSLGGYGYLTALHEIGHALGLSHPFAESGRGSQPTLASAVDIQRNTVMTYTQSDRNSYYVQTGPGSLSLRSFYAVTPGLYDVAAIEYLYGANTTTNTGNTIYTASNWTPEDPLIFRTIVDAGGADTLDFSNQTRASVINLTPGTFSSIGIYTRAEQEAYFLAKTGSSFSLTSTNLYTGQDNFGIAFSSTIENAIGGAGNDTITGNSANNVLKGNGGNDTINGGGGINTAVFNGNYSEYTITSSSGTFTVTDNTAGRDGTDTITNVRYLEFADLTYDTSDASTAPTPAGGALASALAGAAIAADPGVSAAAGSPAPAGGGGGGGFGGNLSTAIGRENFARFQAAMAQKKYAEMIANNPELLAQPHLQTLALDIVSAPAKNGVSWATELLGKIESQRSAMKELSRNLIAQSQMFKLSQSMGSLLPQDAAGQASNAAGLIQRDSNRARQAINPGVSASEVGATLA